ncbi:hypothetical protein P378_00520 [Desulforamulus profundi]|uniref:Copper amine oxidase-like N-terminal domain-containing protein n=2 Tax=Desulforamulus profundi TaxID=1383067 RepID=A0A2C6L4K6_9FIRM|nr:hypothetical protein P378_00520 [Desulforamulus profundi]
MKRMRKAVSILVTLAMLIGLLLPVAAPAAAGVVTYSALSAPTIVPPATGATLGQIQIDLGTVSGNSTAVVSLPNTDYTITASSVTVAAYTGTTAPTATFTVSAAGHEGVLAVSQAPGTASTDVKLLLALSANIPSDADGDIKATINSLSGQLSSGEVIVAKANSGSVEVSLVDTVTISEAGTSATALSVNFKENAAGAIKGENNTIKLTLPKGLTWNTTGATFINVGTGASALGVAAGQFAISGNGDKTLVLNRVTWGAGAAPAKAMYRLSVGVNVNTEDAKFGDVEVTVGGTSTSSPASLVIGKYADYGVSVKAKSVEDITSGRVDEEIGDIEIKEDLADSIYSGRTITLELPRGAKWATIPTTTISGGGPVTISGWVREGSDGRKVKTTVTNPVGGGKATITLENVTIDTAVDFSGDVAVKIAGSAGVAGEVVVAKAVAPITVTANVPDVKIGVQGQVAGDISIVEGKKEAIKRNKELVLTAPVGVDFANLPTVEVTEGDLDIDEKAISKSANTLTIPVTSDSSKASTIKISNIKFTVNRSVPEGPIKVDVAGNAVDEVNDNAVTLAAGFARGFYTIPVSGELFPQNDVAATVINAKVVTPAPAETGSVIFNVGSSVYTTNGVVKVMDAAPYIKNNRTYVPVRFLALSLGVAEENIAYENGVVTLKKGDATLKLTIGDKTMMNNDATVAMDVAPEVVNGRTMLPARFVAEGFGALVGFSNGQVVISY